MSISIAAGDVVSLTLARHAELPEAERPVFRFSAMTLGEYRKVKNGEGSHLDKACDVLRDSLLSWDRVTHLKTGKPLECTADNLEHAITPLECTELWNGLSVTTADKKKTGSGSDS